MIVSLMMLSAIWAARLVHLRSRSGIQVENGIRKLDYITIVLGTMIPIQADS